MFSKIVSIDIVVIVHCMSIYISNIIVCINIYKIMSCTCNLLMYVPMYVQCARLYIVLYLTFIIILQHLNLENPFTQTAAYSNEMIFLLGY